MEKVKDFVKTTLLGGLGVLLPVLILFVAFNAIFRFVTGSIRPIANIFGVGLIRSDFIAGVISILIMVLISFVVGLIVKTRTGVIYHAIIEEAVLNKIPGYKLVKEATTYFEPGKERPFSAFALVRPFGSDTMVNAFITDTHPDGSYSVFVPQGPTLAQGDIYHLKPKDVYILDVPIAEGIKAIISMGAGSEKLLAKYKEKNPDQDPPDLLGDL